MVYAIIVDTKTLSLQFEFLKAIFMDWNSLSDTAIVQEIGKRLKEYRFKKRFTQQEFANQAGISVFSIVQIEQ